MDARPRILVVDDEARSVELLVRALRRIGRVESATSGDEAWAKAQAESPDLVITDQRMPGLKGTELLAKIAERDRYVGRIILTGYADLQATIDAINNGGIHAYVNKPWAPDQLVLTVQGILERVRLERNNAELVSELTTANHGLEVAMSELRAAQTRVLDAERLGAIGQMAAMIVHDFRGPLTVIRSSAGELARTGTELPAEEVVELGASALEEAERMTRMCTELLEVTRASEGDPNREEEPLDDFLESVLAVVAEEAARAAVTVESELRAGVTIGLDSDRMRRALLNLVYNAIEAMPEGGVLRVVSERQGDSVLIRISDSGVGIPEELIERVFEPFVTAGKSGGSGLGLAVVKKVVGDHGGKIEARKAEGGGSCFQISLPLSR